MYNAQSQTERKVIKRWQAYISRILGKSWSTKDVYQSFGNVSEKQTLFSSVIASPTFDTELRSMVDESNQPSTTVTHENDKLLPTAENPTILLAPTAENMTKLLNIWLNRLHKDAQAGEFNEQDLKRHIPALNQAIHNLKEKINSTQTCDWWEIPEFDTNL